MNSSMISFHFSSTTTSVPNATSGASSSAIIVPRLLYIALLIPSLDKKIAVLLNCITFTKCQNPFQSDSYLSVLESGTSSMIATIFNGAPILMPVISARETSASTSIFPISCLGRHVPKIACPKSSTSSKEPIALSTDFHLLLHSLYKTLFVI